MNVLIIGLGKIGKLKAKIYKKLGFNIYYHDINVKEGEYTFWKQAEKDDINLVDICSPTYLHMKHLEQYSHIFPEAIFVIEKPLVNSYRDLDGFKKFIKDNPEIKIIYSENAAFSTVLDEINSLVIQKHLMLEELQIEFSKDRREDVRNGRFFDSSLEGFGIDVPHIITIINRLGEFITSIEYIETSDMVVDNNVYPRQGDLKVFGKLESGKRFKIFQSLVGNYSIKETGLILPHDETADTVFRAINILFSDGKRITAQLEPVPGQDRYKSRICYIENDCILEEKVINDRNLDALLEYFKFILINGYKEDEIKANIERAINVTETLLKMRDKARKNR